ncbi:hypothetical protein BGZ65_009952 [Modicella reniformis]|uniref:3-hydroxyacyl-CoA dehydrogenase NAD binding domain-containing protein n=1 Tax=Modicella reniformis TaxID=1440133 RepID=A0A9P6ISY7_9FUNG|nr:hypothetical protein BGZ65_009952 [Modicella reniformis]
MRVAKKLFPEAVGKQKKRFIDKTISQINTSTDSEAASKDADLIIEAIENLKTKQQLFAMLDKVAPEHTLFCSNTSSFPIENIARHFT